ncbi:unnamed protein product [Arctia plantaginis]|uniref:Uncharacterized protein n=1 Tax=Arctia plantaginis TaxID=874455 RepID=A0A8S1AU81_ARCPL|nr:unnamed protein product [Arctia plantaginis]
MATSSQHNLAEIRGAKILMSSRDSYVNTAVGYVKVSRTGNDSIVTCEDCSASAGGCKQSLLLLFWLEKKSSEPSSTAVECYWNKPSLTSATTEHVSSKEIFSKAKIPKIVLS